MPSANLFLDKRSTTTKGQHPIKIVVNYGGKQRLFSTGKYASVEEYKNFKTSKKHSVKYDYNNLMSKCANAMAIIDRLGRKFTFEKFKVLFYSEIDLVTKGSLISLRKLY